MASPRRRSEKRAEETDHTRITVLEDDVDMLEARVVILEGKEHAREIEEGVEHGMKLAERLTALEVAEDRRQKREAVEAAAGGVVRYLGLVFVALASAACAELLRVIFR